jgi:hypothetical protein
MITTVPGVYQEWLRQLEHLNFEAVIVTAYLPQLRTGDPAALDVIGCAWRESADDEWTYARGFFSADRLRPHPDADRVWADYCAAVLTR